MNTYTFLAFDLGATSGRSIIGTVKDGKTEIRELTRFPNAIQNINGKFYWDIYLLFGHLMDGLRAAAKENIKIDSIGIDTWGVDFAFIGKDGSILGCPRAYRDPYTDGKTEEFFKIVPKKEVYAKTGIQFMNFNSLFQLFAAKGENSSALEAADAILFMPDALSYLLTGKKVCEYTIASTSQFLNPIKKQIDNDLLKAAGVNPALIQKLVLPGEVIGTLTDEIAKETGLDKVPVVAVAGHDTASAIAAIPALDENFAYLSSGTWSLMGIETKEPVINDTTYELNFTNEAGVDATTRLLKNITGMWLLEQCRKEWSREGKDYSYPEIVKMAQGAEAFRSFVDPDDTSFANPESMTEAIVAFCKATGQPAPQTHAQFIRCIFESLALKYRVVLGNLRKLAPFPLERLHVIGGGAQNKLLNQFVADSIRIPVVAGPSEATALGNVMVQAMAVGAVKNLAEIRRVVYNSVSPETFTPSGEAAAWDKAFEKFINLKK